MARYNGPRHYNPAQRRAYMRVQAALPDTYTSPGMGWCGPGWQGRCWADVAIACMAQPGEWGYVEFGGSP